MGRPLALCALVACVHDAPATPQAVTLPSVPSNAVAPLNNTLPTPSAYSEVAGAWNITEGTAQGGNSYSGTVTIKRKGSAFDVDWDVSGTQYSGVGLQYENRLYVGWGTTGDALRVMVYRMRSDGSLLGQWAAGDEKGLGNETATGVGANGLGTFTVSGSGGSGRYTGALAVMMDGDAYKLDWATGDKYYGTGLADGERLGVGWGASEDVGYVEYVFEGDVAKGRWTWRPTPGIFTENLERVSH